MVDPLDGTTNYAHRYPHFAVSIGLEHAGKIILGVVYDPMRDELFVAERGKGATRNGQPIQVSAIDQLERSLLGTGFPYEPYGRNENAAVWTGFLSLCQGVRRDGSAALNLCYVACGRLDGFWERPLNAWDMAAGSLIIEEAGRPRYRVRWNSVRPIPARDHVRQSPHLRCAGGKRESIEQGRWMIFGAMGSA